MYDAGDRRGWLIDGASAVLHLSRTQLSHHESPHNDNLHSDLRGFQHSGSDKGPEAATLALKANHDVVLDESLLETVVERKEKEDGTISTEVTTKVKKQLFHNLVRRNLDTLEKMHDYQYLMMESEEINLRLSDRGRLEGWDFLELVSGEKSLRPRFYHVSPLSRGWVDFTRTIHTINLFARGFGAMIEPANDAIKLCDKWRHVPKQKDYLTVCVSTLDEICRRYGNSQETPFRLANDVYWHKPHLLFEKCNCSHETSQCDRAQVLLQSSTTCTARPEPFAHASGAVIFGGIRSFPWTYPSRDPPNEDIAFAREPSHDEMRFRRALDATVPDSGLGSSVSTQTVSADRITPSAESSSFPYREFRSRLIRTPSMLKMLKQKIRRRRKRRQEERLCSACGNKGDPNNIGV